MGALDDIRKTGIIVDTETTGLEDDSEIIEVGLLTFDYKQNGSDFEIGNITSAYGGMNSPAKAIPEEITKLTGIKQSDVYGRHVKWEAIKSLCLNANVLIAHNAKFDKRMLSNYVEGINQMPWKCSNDDIDWEDLGFGSTKLNYIACEMGIVNPFAHRAIFDCALTYQIIKPYFNDLMNSHIRKYHTIIARPSFERKDEVKSLRYRWHGETKTWQKRVQAKNLQKEEGKLKAMGIAYEVQA